MARTAKAKPTRSAPAGQAAPPPDPAPIPASAPDTLEAANDLLSALADLGEVVGEWSWKNEDFAPPMAQKALPAARRALRRYAMLAQAAADLAAAIMLPHLEKEALVFWLAIRNCRDVCGSAAESFTALADRCPDLAGPVLEVAWRTFESLDGRIREGIREDRLDPDDLPAQGKGIVDGWLDLRDWVSHGDVKAKFHDLCRTAAPFLPWSESEKADDSRVGAWVVSRLILIAEPEKLVAGMKPTSLGELAAAHPSPAAGQGGTAHE